MIAVLDLNLGPAPPRMGFGLSFVTAEPTSRPILHAELVKTPVNRYEVARVSDADDFDIERLKVHKIAPQRPRVHLPVAGALPPADDIDEAFGGSGRAELLTPPEELRERVVETLKSIYDPEIPLNVYDLGLIYGLGVDDEGNVEIAMTLTAPACPVAGQIVRDVAERVGATPGVARAHVKLVWEPAWTKARMTDEALLELGLL